MEGRRMILFFNHTGIRISWIRTECPSSELYCMELQADRFIKREYISIDTMKPEAIVIEQVALENSKDLIEFQNSFPEIKIILIVRDKSELLDLQGIEIVDQNENILESLRKILKISEKPKIDVQKQEMQIGFLSQDRETAVLAAINFVKTLSEAEKKFMSL